MSSQTTKAQQDNRPTAQNRPSNDLAALPGESESTAESTNADSAAPPAETEAPVLPLDLVFDALKNSRRRQILRYLGDHAEPVTLSELAEHVAAIENETTPERLDSQQRKRVYVGLYQCHLPRLADMGVVEFDKSRGHVELGRGASQLETYLYDDDGDERRWYHHHLGFVTVSALVLAGGAATGLVPNVGAVVLFAAISAGVSGIALVHAYDRRG